MKSGQPSQAPAYGAVPSGGHVTQQWGGPGLGAPPSAPYPGSGAPPSVPYPGFGAPPAGAYPPVGYVEHTGAGPPNPAYPAGAYTASQAQPMPAGSYPASGAPPAGHYQGPVGSSGDKPAFQGEVSHEDVMDNPNIAVPQASAPPLDKMDVVNGYEHVGFSHDPLPPPSYDEALTQMEPPERRDVTGVPVITEEQAREALLEHVADHCCYGSTVAKELAFRDLQSSSAFHYTLETFTESRSTAWSYEPFVGQPISSPILGPAPGPWDIAVTPSAQFQNSKQEVEVPHTASVKPCHDCVGLGRVRCYRCIGRGRVICSSCGGSGRESYYEEGHHHHRCCTWCHGSGRRRCYTCEGHGHIPCKTCATRGQLKCFIKLTVKWTNHLDDHIVERTALPNELIRHVTGELAFKEEMPRVWPINHFPDTTINMASSQLVDSHNKKFPTERILIQRHQVRVIPVTEAIYMWRGKTSNFFVYGFEQKVHCPDYPQKCCCGCVIL